MIAKRLICFVKGHDVDPTESIVGDIMIDKRNWLCKCHRCGWYVMHGNTGLAVTIPEKEAIRIKKEFIAEATEIRRMLRKEE